jgi:hypothetical protein
MARRRQEMSESDREALYAKNAEYQKQRRAALTVDERRALRRAVYERYKSDKYRKTSADYMRRRRRENPAAAMAERLRARIKNALKRGDAAKFRSTSRLTGCDVEALRAWLEKQFENGMTWENRSEWHIDHIIPCAAFNLLDESQQEVAFHFSNLRPMWASENIRKKESLPVPGNRLFWTLGDVAEARKALGLIQPPGWRLDRLGRLISTPMTAG